MIRLRCDDEWPVGLGEIQAAGGKCLFVGLM